MLGGPTGRPSTQPNMQSWYGYSTDANLILSAYSGQLDIAINAPLANVTGLCYTGTLPFYDAIGGISVNQLIQIAEHVHTGPSKVTMRN